MSTPSVLSRLLNILRQKSLNSGRIKLTEKNAHTSSDRLSNTTLKLSQLLRRSMDGLTNTIPNVVTSASQVMSDVKETTPESAS